MIAQRAEIRAARTRCARTDRALKEVNLPKLTSALRCLARKDAKPLREGIGEWQSTSFRERGELNAARIWTYLRGTKSGRRALVALAAGRAKLVVRASDRSRVIVRARR